MHKLLKVNSGLAKIVLWLARISSLLMTLLVLAFVIGEGLPNPADLILADKLGFAMLFLMLAGILASWKWEAAGGLLTIAGYLFFGILNNRAFMPGLFTVFPIIGLLFIFHWRLSRIACDNAA